MPHQIQSRPDLGQVKVQARSGGIIHLQYFQARVYATGLLEKISAKQQAWTSYLGTPL